MSSGVDRQLSPQERHVSARALRAGLALVGIDLVDLHASCLMIDSDVMDLRRLGAVLDLDSDAPLSAHQHDVLAQALNDRCLKQDNGHPVRSSCELHG